MTSTQREGVLEQAIVSTGKTQREATGLGPDLPSKIMATAMMIIKT